MDEQGNQVVITLTGISATGYHGVLPQERAQGQTFVVDARLLVSADTRDTLTSTVDYAAVANQIVEVISGDPVDLIETLAARIADVVLTHPRIGEATITVHKPQAPLAVPFADVSVTVQRGRS